MQILSEGAFLVQKPLVFTTQSTIIHHYDSATLRLPDPSMEPEVVHNQGSSIVFEGMSEHQAEQARTALMRKREADREGISDDFPWLEDGSEACHREDVVMDYDKLPEARKQLSLLHKARQLFNDHLLNP